MTELQNLEKELNSILIDEISLNNQLSQLRKAEKKQRLQYIEYFFKENSNDGLDICKENVEEANDVYRAFTPTFYSKKEFYKFIKKYSADFTCGDATNHFNFLYLGQNHYCRNQDIFNDLKTYNDKMKKYKGGFWFKRNEPFLDVLNDNFLRELFKFELDNEIL